MTRSHRSYAKRREYCQHDTHCQEILHLLRGNSRRKTHDHIEDLRMMREMIMNLVRCREAGSIRYERIEVFVLSVCLKKMRICICRK